MTLHRIMLAAAACVALSCGALHAETDQPTPGTFTAPISVFRAQVRPSTDTMPVPAGYTRAQLVHGDRVFHGEAARGQCSVCHGADAKGTTNGNDLTAGHFVWADGSVASIKATVLHNMATAPGMDGDLKPEDVEAVAVYVWSLARPNR